MINMITIYNTLTKQKETFRPINPPQVGLYVCGLTVYDDCHIGHGRLFIWFDALVRYLRSLEYQVTYVRNITDIDDKIIKHAKELGVDWKELTLRMIDSMKADEKALNIIPPDFEPRVTYHIPEIISMIKILIDKGFAYVVPSGDVYYSVEKFKDYGKLAHQDLESLKTGTRVEMSAEKQSPLDFALWKAAKANEPSWPSPWGDGRPGWHIECSAMAKKYLGNNFDIHGGGNDLQFPHHQNELAQSEAANNSPFANIWMHMGFVQINEEKMSKSLGNFFTLKDVLKKYSAEVLRFFILSSHYHSPVNFSEENLDNAESALRRLYITLRNVPGCDQQDLEVLKNNKYYTDFHFVMADDFNTPKAMSILFDLAREINLLRDKKEMTKAEQYGYLLKLLAGSIGLLQSDPLTFLQFGVDAKLIESLLNDRKEARQKKNWQDADKIRDKINSMGVALEDTKDGTVWIVEDRQKYVSYQKSSTPI
jgi:cysteinyl-tRNA synthetase